MTLPSGASGAARPAGRAASVRERGRFGPFETDGIHVAVSRRMDAIFWTAGALAILYTLVEIGGLLLRADPPGRRRVHRTDEFRRATPDFAGGGFQTAAGGSFTIDLQPIPGRQANYYA